MKFEAKIITVGSSTYLGKIAYGDNEAVVKEAMPINGEPTSEDVAEYLKRANAKALEKDVTVKGSAIVTSERDLSDDLQDEAAILIAKFNKAEKVALPNLVNTTFDNLR